jgi:uncharacterized protein
MNVEVRHSSIAGRGLYATRQFKKGEIVLEWLNARELSETEFEALPRSEHAYVDFHDGKIFLMGEPERFMNHSCEANTASQNKSDVALRGIQPGEEITTDYADCNPPGFSMTCSCGSTNCRGIITGIKA